MRTKRGCKASDDVPTALLPVRATLDWTLGPLLVDEVHHPLMIFRSRRRRHLAKNAWLQGNSQ